MASARIPILPILVSCVFISPLSSQQHSFNVSSLLEAKQWTQTPNYPLNTPAPVWIPETPTATEISPDLSGVRSVLLSHVNHIKTTTVFTSQVRLVTADPVTGHTGHTLTTLGSAESPATSFHDVGASGTLVDARRSYTAKGTDVGSFATFNTLLTASGTISLLQLHTTSVGPPLRKPPVEMYVSVIKSKHVEDARSSHSKLQVSPGDAAKSEAQSVYQTLPVIFREGVTVTGDDGTEPVRGEHARVLAEENSVSIESSNAHILDPKDLARNSSEISDNQTVSTGDTDAPLMIPDPAGDHSSLAIHPSSNGAVGEGSGDPVPVKRPAAAWVSEELLGFTEVPSKCSTTGRSPDIMTHVQVTAVSKDPYRTDRFKEETYRPAEEDAAFSTAAAMPVEQNTTKPTARSPVEVGSPMIDVRELRTGTESVPKAAPSSTATPQSANMLVGDESSGDVSKLLATWEYAVDVEGEHASSGDVIHPTFLQQSPDTVPRPLLDLGGLPELLSDANISSDSTSSQPSSSKNFSSRPSSNPTPEVLSSEVPSITSTEAVAANGAASARPSGASETDGKGFADVGPASPLEATVSSEDRPAASGDQSGSDGRPRWLWAVSVPPLLLLLTLLGVAVFWRWRRRRRRKLNISSSSGVVGSPWSRPAQPVLHASGRLEPDPDESLAPPPPSYREYQHSASERCVSLELDESPLSSRQTSGTDVSVDSSVLAPATGAEAENV